MDNEAAIEADDTEETGRLYGLNARQIAFARFLAKGHKVVESARLAGYVGTGLSCTASKLNHNPKVQKFVAVLRERAVGGIKPDRILSRQEVRQRLSVETMANPSPAARISAARALLESEDGGPVTGTNADCLNLLAEIEGMVPGVAVLLAPALGVKGEWQAMAASKNQGDAHAA